MLVRRMAAGLLVLALAVTSTGASVAGSQVAAFRVHPTSVGAHAPRSNAPAATVGSAFNMHIARAGDTLWDLADVYCNTGQAYRSLAAASRISNPDRIRIGQRITIDCKARVAAAISRATRAPARHAQPATVAATGSAAAVAAYVRAQVGHRYVWGTAGPRTFDCSGLVMAAYARVGVRLPHQSGSIMRLGTPVARANLRPGDVIGYPGHVMVYVGGGMIVEAANPTQGVILNHLYWYSSTTARRFA